RPSSIVVNTSPSDEKLSKVLEDAELTNWKVPLCSGADKERINIELVFNFLPPKGVKGEWEHGFDTYQYRIRYRKSPYYLRLDGGPNLGGRDADDDLLAMSTMFEERWVVDAGGIIGVDAKGQLPKGHVWRSVGLMGVAIARYNDVPPEVGTFFDKIIDSLCVAVPPDK
ncbi:MAG TPA: hypothetical protein VLB32_06425, partial [Candidatus Acidoferrales bacterium]|nr:hypothetical protein [Candidatus Acidoferrales bacterium]